MEGDAPLLKRKGCHCKHFPSATRKTVNVLFSPLHPFTPVKLIEVTAAVWDLLITEGILAMPR